MRADRVKLFLDGVIENFTAAMLEPYLGPDGAPTDEPGHWPCSSVTSCWRWPNSWTGRAFTSIATPSATGPCATVSMPSRVPSPPTRRGIGRPTIAHIQVIHPVDLPRFSSLGVVANGQPVWALHDSQMDVLTIPFLGEERTALAIPVRLAPARRGAPCLRERLGRLDRRPADRDGGRGSSHLWPGVATDRSSCRMSASRSRRPSMPSRSARPTSTASRRRPVPSRSASWPTSSSWTATSSHRASLPADARALLTLVEGEPVFEDPGLEG